MLFLVSSKLVYSRAQFTLSELGTDSMRRRGESRCSTWRRSSLQGSGQSSHTPYPSFELETACIARAGGEHDYPQSDSELTYNRWIFIIEGIATIVAGLVAPWFLVEFPERVKFLNPRQKHIAVTRVRYEKEKTDVVHPTVKQTLGMLVDWKLIV